MSTKNEQLAKEIVSSGKNFAKRMPSNKQAMSLAWAVMDEMGITPRPGIGLCKYRGGIIRYSEASLAELSYLYDADTHLMTIDFGKSDIPVGVQVKIDKMIPKHVLKAFDKQGATGDKKAEDIMIVAKLFNPAGAGTWYLYEREDNDIYWCFATLGDSQMAECGTVSMVELANLSLPLGLSIERDRYFKSISLADVMAKVKAGKHV